MDNHFERGSCDITWKIENFSFSNKKYESPTFYLGNSQETNWYLRVRTYNLMIFCYLDSKHRSDITTIYYDATIYCNGDSQNESKVLTFPEGSHASLVIFSLKRVPFRSLMIKVYLRNITDLSSLLHRLTFRTVEEVETRRVSYDIPRFKELLAGRIIFFRVLPVGENSILFELKMWVINDKDFVKTLRVDIRESSKTKQFDLYCKISAEDNNGKLLSSATQTQTFKAKEDNVCSLKLLFSEDSLKSFSSSNHKLILNCEFLTTNGKTFSWLEESSTISIHQDNSRKICSKSLQMEKINLRDDFLCLYVEGKCTDAVISAQGHKFTVHKTILRARSPVFEAMFVTEMIEKENNLTEILDIEADTLERMIIFMYSDILQTEEYEKIFKLYEAADKYQVLTLKEKCSAILKQLLDTQNAIEMLILTDMHHDAELRNSVEIFICGHAEIIFKKNEWKALMEEKPSLGCTVMYKFCMENI